MASIRNTSLPIFILQPLHEVRLDIEYSTLNGNYNILVYVLQQKISRTWLEMVGSKQMKRVRRVQNGAENFSSMLFTIGILGIASVNRQPVKTIRNSDEQNPKFI